MGGYGHVAIFLGLGHLAFRCLGADPLGIGSCFRLLGSPIGFGSPGQSGYRGFQARQRTRYEPLRVVAPLTARQAVRRNQDADRLIIAELAAPAAALREAFGAGSGNAAEVGQFIEGQPPAVRDVSPDMSSVMSLPP